MHVRSTITMQAPAKLNLALSVGPPQEDGMHPICSWMVTVNLFDDLIVTRLDDDRLSRYAILWHEDAPRRSEINWSITKDLAVQAHLALEEAAERHLPIQMKLEKRIPVGAGLGGGSSDAAAMLHALNDLFDLGMNTHDLASIGHDLGSDVPFLVHGGSAIVSGLGDNLESQAIGPDLYPVLVFPDLHCHTGSVYRAYDALGPRSLQPEAVQALAAATQLPEVFNDLLDAALEHEPQLRGVQQAVSDLAEQPVYLSGSGASLFLLADEPLHAQALADAITSHLSIPAIAVQPVPGCCVLANAEDR
jgi:4-diphosphocytidyl-2-C-methyl-D-erythritol kinase